MSNNPFQENKNIFCCWYSEKITMFVYERGEQISTTKAIFLKESKGCCSIPVISDTEKFRLKHVQSWNIIRYNSNVSCNTYWCFVGSCGLGSKSRFPERWQNYCNNSQLKCQICFGKWINYRNKNIYIQKHANNKVDI